ncbi:RICIN domain-containing protein [Streptomyces sp. H27-H1]|uniref:RICIN domain-containing protein n=1 Tax=Streptomyces sp. H27-H1 TaxID=2996461 RepID=UPI00226D4F61|nr:RICIN domain-containing protein [Streptomyces sp. H27-H1]MCY0932507.1 RICIN domain-containing protein [Streptomyces sp. H27-H1]
MTRTLHRGVIAVLMSLLVLLIPTPANAADPAIQYTTSPFNAAIYEMRASYSWQCLDVRGESQSPGAVIQRYDCKGKLHQRFYFMSSNTPGMFYIGVFGKYCIGAANASTADNTPIVMGYCQGPGQHFRWVDQGNNHWEIVEAASGKCLHDTGRGSAIQLRACGNIAEPYPSLWTPLYHRQYNYGSVWG